MGSSGRLARGDLSEPEHPLRTDPTFYIFRIRIEPLGPNA